MSYTSNRSNVVQVTGKTLKAVGSGIATVTATVNYHGDTASTSFTSTSHHCSITSNPSTVFQAGNAGAFTVTTDVTDRDADRVRSAAQRGHLHRQR